MSNRPRDVTTPTYYERCALSSTDAELIEHLLNPQFCARAIPQTDPSQLEAGIAELMCEAVRRGLEIPDLVHEGMLPAHALSRVVRAIETGDAQMAWNAMPYLNGGALWIVFRRHRDLPVVPDRPFLWLEELPTRSNGACSPPTSRGGGPRSGAAPRWRWTTTQHYSN